MRRTTPSIAFLVAVAALLTLSVASCKRPEAASNQPHVAYVTNGIAAFWTIAKAGAEAAGRDLSIKVSVHMPAEGIADQKRIIEDLIIKGVDGVAISPIDSANQASFINDTATHTALITQDSDAPDTNRLAYIGMDNYQAGRMVGEIIKESLPNGGKLAIFVGRLEQDNARKRRQGVIDEVLGRNFDSSRYDAPGRELSEGKFSIVVTLTDQFDRVKAKGNCEDAMLRHPDLAGIVGLFGYNAPICIEALKQHKKLGAIKVFSFDEADETLQGIKDGTVAGTVVQNPYEYGFQSVKLLREILAGNRAAIPDSKIIDIPARRIDRSNVEPFWADLKAKLSKS